MDPGEIVLHVVLPGDYKGFMLFIFENGKVAKVELSAYETKSNRRKLTGAYSDKAPVKAIFCLSEEDKQLALFASDGRCLIFSAAQLQVKTTRNTIGVAVMTLKKNKLVERAQLLEDTSIQNPTRYRSKTLPTAGAILKEEDSEEKQQALF
jgi:DNA gyrase subunit A